MNEAPLAPSRGPGGEGAQVAPAAATRADRAPLSAGPNDLRDRLWDGLTMAFWTLLVCWKLTSIPGVNMDEAWSIMAARGVWQPADPLSGMTRYSGALPVLLLWWTSTEAGVAVLRWTSVACNGLALCLLIRVLRRVVAPAALRGWALPLLATLPVWLVMVRNGIELAMFTPLLTVLGLYLLLSRRWLPAFFAGVSWGLLAYSHLLGLFGPLSLGLSWLCLARRLPPLRWPALLAGFALGFAPRVIALLLFFDRAIEGTASGYRLGAALADLLWMPAVLWSTLNGGALYLRFVGRQALAVWPYWVLALLLLLPWRKRLGALPRSVWVAALSALLLAVFGCVATPGLTVRYMMLPCIGVCAAVILLGASAIEADARAALLVRGVAAALVCGNLIYLGLDFYRPWQRDELAISSFALGWRNRKESNKPMLPKDALVAELRGRGVQQVLASPSLERPLRLLLPDDVRVVGPAAAEAGLRSAWVLFDEGRQPEKRCTPAGPRKLCFRSPERIARYYWLYMR
jgi:hypothetical protein